MEKNKTRSSKKNTKSIFKSKEAEEMFDKEERHRHYLVGSICRDIDELYSALLTYNDQLFCQDVIVLFQNVVYDFVTLMEWCRLKSLYRELPPPVRINFSECFGDRDACQFSDCDNSVDDVRLETVLTNEFKKKDEEQVDFGCKKSGTNVSAPDFVPTKVVSQSPLTIDTFSSYDRILRNESRTSKEVFDKQIDELTSEFLYSDQRSNDLAKNDDQVFRYQQPLPPPNFLHYPQVNLTSFQHHMPHYLTHFHLPYSVCSNGNLLPLTPVTNVVTDQIQASSDVRNSLLYGYPISTFSEQRLTSFKLKSRKSNSHEKHNFDNNYPDSIKGIDTSKALSKDNGIPKYDSLTENDTQISDCEENMSINISSNLNTPKIYSSENSIDKTMSLSHFATPLSKEEVEMKVGGSFSAKFESDQKHQIGSTSFKLESQVHNEKQNVLGLPEKECQLQFPELKPYQYRRNKNFRRKHFPRVKFQKCTKFSLGLTDDDTNTKSRKSTVITCNSGDVIFTGQTDRRSLLFDENKRKNINSKHYATVRTKPFRNKPSREEKPSHDPVKYSDYLDSNIGESDGWKMVKVRTKMRDKYGSKQVNINKRLPVFKNSSFSAEPSLLINKDNFTCNSQYMLRESNPNYESVSVQNENINNDEGLVKSEHNLFSLSESQMDSLNCENLNIGESTLSPEEANVALARMLHNGTELANFGLDSSFTDLPLPSYNGPESTREQILRLDSTIENIFPNDMYSVYMKYLNNTSESLSILQQFTDIENSDSVHELDFHKKLEVKTKNEDDTNTITKNEAKQQQAHEKRLQLLQCKTAKIREFVQKVQDVKAAQYQLALQRKTRIDLKLKKAEENRNLHLSIIRRKAHDEEEKLKEIAFINELEAQNRRHDSLALRQEHEERLQYLIEERQRRLEEKAAKEAAVEERRRVLEAERQEKLEKMQEKRRRKEEIIGRKQQEKEKERLVIAREKAREREERLQARHAAQLATLEELQKRIQQKQEESARRHEENIELIRQKALEVGLHRNILEDVPTTNWYRSDDQLKIETSFKQNSVQEKMKAQQKKRLKKIKLRMETRGSCYRQNMLCPSNVLEQNCESLKDHIHELEKLKIDEIIPMEETVLDSVDHIVEEILKLLRIECSTQVAFKDFNGFILLESIFRKFVLVPHDLLHSNVRTIGKLVSICDLSLKGNQSNCSYLLMSNCISPVLDLLKHAIQVPIVYLQGTSSKPYEIVIVSLLNFLNTYFSTLDSLNEEIIKGIDDFPFRVHDLVSYVICSGLIAKIIHLFRTSKSDAKVKLVLLNPSIGFFSSLLTPRFKTDELLNMLQSTELLGTVPLLYEGLVQYIHKTGSLPDYTLSTINFLIRLAKLDLKSFQTILGAGDIGLQFRGIASGLMSFCVKNDMYGELLHLVIVMVGYFALHNKNNQTLLQSGKQPTVLQQLVNLPFQYFCDPSFMKHLFPTLISCSYHNPTNRAIVEDELNYSVLEDFIASDEGKKDELVLLCTSDSDDKE